MSHFLMKTIYVAMIFNLGSIFASIEMNFTLNYNNKGRALMNAGLGQFHCTNDPQDQIYLFRTKLKA